MDFFYTLLYYFFSIVLIVLSADFVSGIGHWFEDVYGHPEWPIIGKYIVQPNIEHHSRPRKFLKKGYFSRNGTSLLIALVFFVIFFFINLLSWQAILLIAYLSQVNEVHAISHRRKEENSRFFRFLQRIGLIQSNLHHGWHHAAPYDVNYCIMTEYLNPVLEKLNFFERIEKRLAYLGIHPLRGTEVRDGM